MSIIVDEEEVHKSLSFNLLLRDIPALTFELGKPNIVSESYVTYGLEAIWNILADLDMIAPRDKPFRYPLPPGYAHDKLLRYSDKPYGAKTGIIRFLAAPGDVVKTGQPLAKIVNAFGRSQETMTAVEDGIVLGHSDSSVAFPGVPIMACDTDFARRCDSISARPIEPTCSLLREAELSASTVAMVRPSRPAPTRPSSTRCCCCARRWPISGKAVPCGDSPPGGSCSRVSLKSPAISDGVTSEMIEESRVS